MDISITWHNPLALIDGSKLSLTFTVEEAGIPDKPGCYVFFNQYGDSKHIIYIGQAKNLNSRVNQQFKTNVRLMNVIKEFGRGSKKLMYCTIKPKRAQRIERLLKIVEKSLIKHALTNGHELINIQGSKINFHEIESQRGNRTSEELFGRKMLSQIQ